jgi:hypothetical protein
LDERKETERKLILLILVLVLIFGSFDFIFYGLWKKTMDMYADATKVDRKITIVEQTIEQTRKASDINPNDELKHKIVQLERQSDDIEKKSKPIRQPLLTPGKWGSCLGLLWIDTLV